MVSKVQERIFAETAARLLGGCWRIFDISEPPDFEIHAGSQIFGLEVTQIFENSAPMGGSPMKKDESKHSMLIGKLANEYYARGGVPVSAQFMGLPNNIQIDRLIDKMVNDAPTDLGSHKTTRFENIRVSMTPAPPLPPNYSRWTYIHDRVGMVRQIISSDIQKAINSKQRKLPLYKQKFSDIILLIVADCVLNSGKLKLNSQIQIDSSGFHSVYFLSYPESIHQIA